MQNITIGGKIMDRKKIFKWICITLLSAAVLTFIGRVVYECNRPEPEYFGGGYSADHSSSNMLSSSVLRTSNNYAKEKYDYAPAGGAMQFDRQYEQIADLSARTTDFENDEKKLYGSAVKNQAIIQHEAKTGLSGRRVTSVTLGVKPENFDKTVEELSSIGTMLTPRIVKNDKTPEYKNLLAERATLEKTKENYIALRAHNASLSERLSLEQKIIEVEAQLQAQDVSLSDFTVDEGLCTVNFTLSEAAAAVGRSFVRILASSAKWTVTACFMGLVLIIMFLIVACGLLGLILLGEKIYVEFIAKK